jgi:hypothetical protein
MQKEGEGRCPSTPLGPEAPDPRDFPLIVTLVLDEGAQAFFDALRTRYFPPARLFVGAHVTMFHAIPAAHEHALLREAEILCAATDPFAVTIKGLRFLGRGVAYDLASPQAQAIRARLAAPFAAVFTTQDQARWSPHVTIQNKVDPTTARATQAELANFVPPPAITANALAIWRYRQGPWSLIRTLRFAQNPQTDDGGSGGTGTVPPAS